MMILYLLTAVIAVASAMAGLGSQPQGPSNREKVRGPCPVLNSLANHGFINKDGKNLSRTSLVHALEKNLKVSKEIGNALFSGGVQTSSKPGTDTFSLDDLNKHNIIEHDGSLSRKDVSVDGDNHSFAPEVFAEYLGYLNGSDTISIPAAAAARWGRIQTSKARNPSFTYDASNRQNSYAETAILLELFRDPVTKLTSKQFVKILFEEERFPFKEGWRATNDINGFTLLGDVLLLALNTPEKEPGVQDAKRSIHGAALI